jgi:hypothetical protein
MVWETRRPAVADVQAAGLVVGGVGGAGYFAVVVAARQKSTLLYTPSMRRTFEELRAAHRGKWLLIRTDGKEAQTCTLHFADKDPDRVGEEMLRQSEERDREQPLYITWSIPDDRELPAFIL